MMCNGDDFHFLFGTYRKGTKMTTYYLSVTIVVKDQAHIVKFFILNLNLVETHFLWGT